MIRAVFDANVLVAGLLATTGPLSHLIDLWRAGEVDMVISEPILEEVKAAWAKPYWQVRLSREQAAGLIGPLQSEATFVPLSIEVHEIAAHAEDDLVLATALSAGTHHLVTGDRELLRLRRFRNTAILDPRAFLEIVQR